MAASTTTTTTTAIFPSFFNTRTDTHRHSTFPQRSNLTYSYSYKGLGTTFPRPGSWSSIRVSRTPGGMELEQPVKEEALVLLQKGIAQFYDKSSGLWEDIWGDHMHHGFYDLDSTVSVSDHRPAQIRMIDEALRFASFSSDEVPKNKWPKSIVDVGCGIGGSSRYLAQKFGATTIGITLSPVQAARANALAAAQGLAHKVSFQVVDALEQPFPDGQFDLVWSMESGEHMPDKAKFVAELARVAAPGATIIIVTWCHRDLGPAEESLKPWEENLLKKICNAFYLPAWCSTADYVRLLESLSLQDIKSADWSPFVAPFWPAVIRSALTWKGLTSLLRSDFTSIVRDAATTADHGVVVPLISDIILPPREPRVARFAKAQTLSPSTKNKAPYAIGSFDLIYKKKKEDGMEEREGVEEILEHEELLNMEHSSCRYSFPFANGDGENREMENCFCIKDKNEK